MAMPSIVIAIFFTFVSMLFDRFGS
jgi:hypothetical protein